MSGVICGRRTAAKLKGKFYKVVVRPAVKYGIQTMGLSKRQKAGGGEKDVEIFRRNSQGRAV